jgi:hypothetical protein
MQGVPGSRHAPGPRSQRLVVALQTPEQHAIPASPPVHASPEERHAALESSAQVPLLHEREQHSPSAAHASPITLQIGAPQTPPLHPSEQQASARSHSTPSELQ